MEAVKAEIGIYASSPYGSQSTISAVTFGGGTPSALSAERMVEMLKSVQANYRVTPDAQISFEGSPATLTLEKNAGHPRPGGEPDQHRHPDLQ
ncbi:hypothetical protein ACFSQ7_43090 [Paenibacillus rhizoplanae]